MTPKNIEQGMYRIIIQRGKIPDLSYDEFLEAAIDVVAEIPVEVITPVEEMLERLEARISERRGER